MVVVISLHHGRTASQFIEHSAEASVYSQLEYLREEIICEALKPRML